MCLLAEFDESFNIFCESHSLTLCSVKYSEKFMKLEMNYIGCIRAIYSCINRDGFCILIDSGHLDKHWFSLGVHCLYQKTWLKFVLFSIQFKKFLFKIFTFHLSIWDIFFELSSTYKVFYKRFFYDSAIFTLGEKAIFSSFSSIRTRKGYCDFIYWYCFCLIILIELTVHISMINTKKRRYWCCVSIVALNLHILINSSASIDDIE